MIGRAEEGVGVETEGAEEGAEGKGGVRREETFEDKG